MYYSGKTLKWWTHGSFSEKLKAVLEEAGYDAKKYPCHLFRQEGASFEQVSKVYPSWLV